MMEESNPNIRQKEQKFNQKLRNIVRKEMAGTWKFEYIGWKDS